MKLTVKSIFFATTITFVGLNFTACTIPPPTPKKEVKKAPVPVLTEEQKHAKYKSAMRIVGSQIKQDMNYQKLDLSTPKLKNWFTDITYKVWDHQISQGQFIDLGLKKFPRHYYEFEVISVGLLSDPKAS